MKVYILADETWREEGYEVKHVYPSYESAYNYLTTIANSEIKEDHSCSKIEELSLREWRFDIDDDQSQFKVLNRPHYGYWIILEFEVKD